MTDHPSGSDHSDEEVDRKFEELTADWDDSPEARSADESSVTPAEPVTPKTFEVPMQWRSSTGPHIVDQHEAEFVPPEPAPLPSDEGFWVTLGCLAGGPLWLLYLLLFDRYAPTLWWMLALAVTVVGVVLLVVRQPRNRDEDDPFDDGARL